MALSQSQKIIAFLEKHRGGSFTARQIAEAIVQQYASDYAKKRNNPRFADDKAFLSQIIAEIGSQKDTLKRLRPHSYGRTGPSPAATAFHWKRRRRRWIRPKVKPVNAMRRSSPVKNGPCWNRSFTRFSPVISGRSCTSTPCCIREGRSHNTRGNGGNQWLHPDIVAMEPVDKAWGKHVKACGHASGSTCVRLWSFEVKKTLTVANIRNASFMPSATRLGRTRGISSPRPSPTTGWNRGSGAFSPARHGVILLDPENPSESEILLPAQKKPDADWQSLIASPKKTEISTNSLSWFPSTSKPGRCGKRIGTTRRPDGIFV